MTGTDTVAVGILGATGKTSNLLLSLANMSEDR